MQMGDDGVGWTEYVDMGEWHARPLVAGTRTLSGCNALKARTVAVVVSAALTAALVGCSPAPAAAPGDQATADSSFLPPMTMIYEKSEGALVSVGNEPDVVIGEVHRLEYRSETDWVDTVIEATPVVDLIPGGQYNRVGSYEMVVGNRFTSFDAGLGSPEDIDEEEIAPNTIMVPNAALVPYHRVGFINQSPTPIDTDATVCFRDDCELNARGFLYLLANGKEIVFADYARLVPLRSQNFVVRELRIDDVKR